MVEFLTGVYLFYMFIVLYFFFFYILSYLQNKKFMFWYPKPKRKYSLSIIIPAYNEQESIEDTIKSVFNSSYKGIIEVIAVNDGSSDNTKKIIKDLTKKYKKLKLLDKKNSGKADSINQALKIAKGELVAIVDADSYPEKDSISKMIGFFNDKRLGGVTSAILVKNQNNFIEKLQAIEYSVIAWTRKLLDFVDAIYVTPGPLTIYRRKVLLEVGGFDTKNLTEDIEMTWRLIHNRYKIRMCLDSNVFTVVPSKFKKWWNQRIRWNIGGLQSIIKYKKDFLRKGMLGYFILPFFIISLFIGLLGLIILSYRIIRRIILTYLRTNYSLQTNIFVENLQDINLTPSILIFFGITMLILSFIFTLLALYVMKNKQFKQPNLFNVVFYMLIYLTVYPSIIITALYRVIRRKNLTW